MEINTIQWIVLIGLGVFFTLIAPFSRTKAAFFDAQKAPGRPPNFWVLTSSLVISWIFAKSITNASDLGLKYGIVGGLAYATYYVSFLVAGIIIFRLRVKGGFRSIHHFLHTRYGKYAVLVFSILIGFRLFNEVWSNSIVIGRYFGATGTTPYYTAILVFTGLTLGYVLKGGLRSSLLTDFIQMILFAVLLIILLTIILPKANHPIGDYLKSGQWSLETGVNLILVALLQVFSYPFHDPVLTDRAFIAPPKQTLKSFILSTGIGFVCIVLFSLIGVSAQFMGLTGKHATIQIGKLLGIVPLLLLNLIMITSAASTIDSTFSSFSKLTVIDMLTEKKQTVLRGRLMMVFIAVAGTLPVFLNPTVLSATTISGTMVIGLTPIFICWKRPAPRLSFFLSIGFGVLVGILYASGNFPTHWLAIKGPYGSLLSANLCGVVGCFILFFTPIAIQQWSKK